MKKSICFWLMVTGFAFGSFAYAADAPQTRKNQPQSLGPMEEKLFKDMDSNNDGAISKAEFEAFHAKRFKDIDSNGDGKITREELQIQFRKMAERSRESFREHFNEADVNHDGALSREEAKNIPMLAKHFDEVDSNKDGKVTAEEMAAVMQKMHQSSGAAKGNK